MPPFSLTGGNIFTPDAWPTYNTIQWYNPEDNLRNYKYITSRSNRQIQEFQSPLIDG